MKTELIASPEQAYEFVQTGQWTFSEFNKWVTNSRNFVDSAYDEGYNTGWHEGYISGSIEGSRDTYFD